MESRYSPSEIEQKWYTYWEEAGLFKANPQSGKPAFSILMPPPNLTGDLHLGHVMEHAIMDSIARYKRMQGFDVLLQPGVDHAGIQLQGTLDKKLSKEKINPKALSREEYLEKAWEFKEQNYASVARTFRQTGISADWSREVFTLDPQVQRAVFTEFKTYYDQGLIYKGPYIVSWCAKCGTAIEDVETEYQERTEQLYFIKYKVVDEEHSSQILKQILSQAEDDMGSVQDDTNNNRKRPGGSDQEAATSSPVTSHQSPASQSSSPALLAMSSGKLRQAGVQQSTISPIGEIVIATARPETIYADTGIAVYPNHPQFKQFVGKKAVNPLNGELVPIFEDDRVEKDFGTGALKITPGHDPLDYTIGTDHRLPILHVVGKDGKLTDLAQDLAGVRVDEARKQAAAKLAEIGAIAKQEEYTHQVPVCERCKTTVEPLISEEWFVKMKPLAEKALQAIVERKVRFLPDNYNEILTRWLESIHDWTISRSQVWGHRIPVWYKDDQQKVSFESPGSGWEQDPQVLDTWFSSSLWPMSTLGWPNQTTEFEKYYPWDLETSAPEIKFLWIARMIMLGLWFTDQVPFRTQFFHGTLRDLKGQKFSKSLGNGIDPIRLFETWGVDATRMTVLSYSIPGRDGRVSNQTIDERAKNYRNFATKLWNIARFILSESQNSSEMSNSGRLRVGQIARRPENDSIQQPGLHPDDADIITKLNATITKVTKNIDAYELHLAAESLYEFIWNDFANEYIEKTKNRRQAAQPTLAHVLKTSIQLLHPFMPFVTEEINQQWSQLHPDRTFVSLMISPWPTQSAGSIISVD